MPWCIGINIDYHLYIIKWIPLQTLHTCSDKELLYFFDILFFMVSFTDFTFLPRDIREAEGDLTTSL